MRMKGNTIFISGGGSGIGRALAEAFQRSGNQVIIAGRRKAVLDEVTRANPGMAAKVLDMENAADIQSIAQELIREFPKLNVVIHSAGIMRLESLQTDGTDIAETTVATNLLGPIRLNTALMPFLLSQPDATIMTVSSGLAFVPRVTTPSYAASKAAIHSYTLSLRSQLRDSKIQVIELIPPYVQTELMGPDQAKDPNAMPLKDFIAESLGILANSPHAEEVCVERVKVLRFAERSGNYDAILTRLNGLG